MFQSEFVRHYVFWVSDMTLREVTDRRTWDQSASSLPRATFLQSWAWGEAQAALGKRVRRFAIQEAGQVRFLAQAIEEKRRGLSYWFVPGGPIPLRKEVDFAGWKEAVDILQKAFLKGSAVFLRIEPFLYEGDVYPEDWIPVKSFNPAVHWMVDLRGKTEAQVLAEMEQKTRYNVRLGERHGVSTRLSTEDEDFKTFLSLIHEMGERNGITVHSDSYLKTTFFAMAKLGVAKLRVAEYEGRMLAGSIEVTFGDTVTYLHGASSSHMRDLKAPQVLQWHAIRDAIRSKHAWYDFGGCNPLDIKSRWYKKSLEGVTRFKEGWGGERVTFVGTFVLPRFGFLGRFFKN